MVWCGTKINVIFDIPKKRRSFLNFFVECHPNVTRTAGPGMLPHFSVRIVETLNEPYLTVMKKYLLWICTAAARLAAGTSCTDDPEVDRVGRVGLQQQSQTASGEGEVLTLNVPSISNSSMPPRANRFAGCFPTRAPAWVILRCSSPWPATARPAAVRLM